MHGSTGGSPRTGEDWFNVSPAPHHCDKGAASTVAMKGDLHFCRYKIVINVEKPYKMTAL